MVTDAHCRVAIERIRPGSAVSAFQASQQASSVLRAGEMVLSCYPDFPESFAKLKCRTTPVSHIDKQVEDPQKLLSECQTHRRIPVGKVLHQPCNPRRNEGPMPALQLCIFIPDDGQHLIGKRFRWV